MAKNFRFSNKPPLLIECRLFNRRGLARLKFHSLMRPKSFWCQLAPARPVGALWTILSFLVSLICIFAFIQPVWFTGRWSNRGLYHLQPPHMTLGLFTFCQQVHGSSPGYQCYHHERLYDLKLPPSFLWQMSVVSYGIGSGLFLLTAFAALSALCCRDGYHTRVAAITSSVQLFCGK